MSTAAAGDRRAGRVLRFLVWFGHFEPHVLLTLGVVTAVGVFAGPRDVEPSALPWLTASVVAAGIAWAAAIIGGALHSLPYPCPRCVARFPVDAPAEAARKAGTLRRFHKSRLMIAVLGGYLVLIIAVPVLVMFTGPEGLGPVANVAINIAYLVMYPVLAYYAYERHTHRKLQPWCPVCRRRDEGDDPIVIPVPTPPSARVDA